jgi:hypothetical protein
MKPVYHYTTELHLFPILESGQINPATAWVFPPEIPAVWLSIDPEWEYSATRPIPSNTGEPEWTVTRMIPYFGRLARIEIDPRLVDIIPPLDIRSTLKIKKRAWESLVTTCAEAGARLSDWRAVRLPIPKTAFVRVQLAKEFDPFVWEDGLPERIEPDEEKVLAMLRIEPEWFKAIHQGE